MKDIGNVYDIRYINKQSLTRKWNKQNIEKGELQESYNTWVDEVENTIKQVQKIKKKNPKKRHSENPKKEKKS